MFHKDVLERFKDITHISDDKIKEWYPNGKNSVRVELKNGYQLILSYFSVNNWRLETYGSYVDRLEEKANLMRKSKKS